MTRPPRSIPQPSVSYGFSCITVTTVMQENLLSEPHAVHCRVSCIMGAPNHNARNSIVVGRASPRCLRSPGFGHARNHRPAGRPRFRGCSTPPVPQTYRRVWLPADSLPVKRTERPAAGAERYPRWYGLVTGDTVTMPSGGPLASPSVLWQSPPPNQCPRERVMHCCETRPRYQPATSIVKAPGRRW